MNERNEERSWGGAIRLLYHMVYEDDEKIVGIEADGEHWTVTDSKYSEERNRLTVEFDGGEFLVIVEYSRPQEKLSVTGWRDRHMVDQHTGLDYDDCGIDEDSRCVLQLVYYPKLANRPANREFMLRDPECGFDCATPGQVALFAELVRTLTEYAGGSLEKPFEFGSARQYAEKQLLLYETYRLMREGMVSHWRTLGEDWDTLNDV